MSHSAHATFISEIPVVEPGQRLGGMIDASGEFDGAAAPYQAPITELSSAPDTASSLLIALGQAGLNGIARAEANAVDPYPSEPIEQPNQSSRPR